MSNQNPQVESPPPPSADEAIQPNAPDFIETREVAPLSLEREPLPVWLLLLCGFALFLAGSSFTGFGIFGQDLLDQGPGGPVLAGGSQAMAEAPTTPMDIGKKLYGNNCATCHQASGEGAAGQWPPLVGSEWVAGSKERLADIMLAGVSGPITVKGATFSALVMPGWAGNFTDEKLADIMTFVRASWGNTAGAVKPEEVAAARAKVASHLAAPYSESDLLKIAPNGPDPSDKKP
jgi:mono/diheme cytochrome c family protein